MSPTPRASDVARRAGVSVTAVSFVMNGNDAGNIAPGTRERILTAAAELGYRPNRVAASLRRQRTHTIGLVTDEIATSPFAGSLLAGAIERARRADHVVIVHDSGGDRELEQAAATDFAHRQVDGLVYATMGFCELDAVLDTRLPMVLANCHRAGAPLAAVIPDDVGGARAATEYLIGLGHRRITMLSGRSPRHPGDQGGNVSGPLRRSGFRAAARAAGITAEECRVDVCGWDIDDGYRGATRALTAADGTLLPDAERPTALFAVTDRAATGVLLAAARLGLAVPRDLSVVGFDDMDPIASHVVPALTTMALPHARMGERAVELLLDRIADPGRAPEPTTETLPCALVVRDSAGPRP